MKALAIAALLALSAPAAAAPLAAGFFCRDNAAVCRAGGAGEIALTDQSLADLKAVNARVNRAIRPKVDGADVWTVNPEAGDCEDYTLTKRAALMRAGYPANALRMGIGKTRSGESHAILIVLTSAGPLALDNLRQAVMPLAQNGIRISGMSGGDLREWSYD